MASLVMWFNKKIVSKRINTSHINLSKNSSYARNKKTKAYYVKKRFHTLKVLNHFEYPLT